MGDERLSPIFLVTTKEGSILTLLQRIEKLLIPLDAIIRLFLITSFLGMVIAVSAQVLYRYVLSTPIPWAEELARFLFAWVTFLGASVAAKNKAHTGVELFVSFFSEKVQRIVTLVAYLICMGFVVLVGRYGFALVSSTMTQRSPALHLSMSIPYTAVPLGCLFMFIYFVYLFVVEINKMQQDSQQQNAVQG